MIYRYVILLVAVLLLLPTTVSTVMAETTTQTVITQDHNSGELQSRAKKKKKRQPAPTRRTYTKRGKPSVTRRVATELIIEKLPELARLVDLLPVEEDNDDLAEAAETTVGGDDASLVDAEDVTASIPVAAVTTGTDDYDDTEIDEQEDTDRLTAADEEMLELEDEDLTIDAFYEGFTDYMRSIHGEEYVTDNGIDMAVMMETLVDWLGTRYLFGGTTERGIDCSAFSRMMCRSVGIGLPRTAAAQWDAQGEPVEREELQFGDLVFFHTRKAVWVSHVGVYLGNDMFCHASSRNGVTVSSLNSSYYNRTYIGARRFYVEIDEEETEETETEVEVVETAAVDAPIVIPGE